MDRIQRTRKAGSRLPPNTLVVTRGTPFGNPFKARNEADRDRVIIEFQGWLSRRQQYNIRMLFIEKCKDKGIEHLACFCPPHGVCHADVWLEIWTSYIKAPAPFEMIGWDRKEKVV